MNVLCYFTFATTYYAIRAEKMLKDSYSFKMVPVPRSISSSCGTALRCNCKDLEAIKDLFIECGVEYEDIYRIAERERPSSIRSLFKKGKLREK